jgi:sugar lactone lactonase YvrE/nucleoside-diphosphate-sugar epimerase
VPHFESLGWQLRLTDILPGRHCAIEIADLSAPVAEWEHLLRGIDVIVHLAGASSPAATWQSAVTNNIDVTTNVMQAAMVRGIARVVFASSTWVVGGYEHAAGVALDSLSAPKPVGAYGASKLFGERLGAMIAARSSTSVISLRVGLCAAGDNPPPAASEGLWEQRKWVSDPDLCAGFERAVMAPPDIRGAIVNLVSDNADMAWDLEEARRLIGYEPVSRSAPIGPAHAGAGGARSLPRRAIGRLRRMLGEARVTVAAHQAASPDVALAVRFNAALGEGPFWHPAEACLYWVDILAPAVHRFDPSSCAIRTTPLSSPVGAVVGCASGGMLAATQAGLLRLRDGCPPETLAVLEPDQPRNRLNDGKCDAAGRFWVGSMALDGSPRRGRLYRVDVDGTATCMDRGLSLCNGLGWSPDNRTMYLTDTPNGRIYAYDFDLDAGEVANRRVLVQVANDTGWPDGLAVDAEGCLWSAHWDGWRITRYDPAGRTIGTVAMPVARPTSCAFGGAALDRLYVTSARTGLSRAVLRRAPLSGSLFTIDTGVVGCPVGLFGAPSP